VASRDEGDGPARSLARTELLTYLREIGVLRSERIAEALSLVPREAFLPPDRRAASYVDQAIVIKWDSQGTPISSLSQPQIVVATLELLDVHPGQRVLEVGTGSGYNAGLLRVLVGVHGEVISLELDRDLAQQAQQTLDAIGCVGVRVEVADGSEGYRSRAPYDRIVVTTGAPEIYAAWIEQLVDRGRLVVPIVDRRSGVGSLFLFEKREGELIELAKSPCGFLPMRRI
jgi:protein-L-isoaspartate(D-aspartate) O-methyltransferase